MQIKTIGWLGNSCPGCGCGHVRVWTDNNADSVNPGDEAECARCGRSGEVDCSTDGVAFVRWKFKKIFSGVDVDIATFLTIAWERNISGCREYPGILKDMQRILLASYK